MLKTHLRSQLNVSQFDQHIRFVIVYNTSNNNPWGKFVKKPLLALLFSTILNLPAAEALQPHQWHKTNVPGNPSLRGSAVYGNTLWVSGTDNGVFKSIDGGKSWQDISVKSDVVTDFRDIEVFDEKTALVLGVGTGKPSRVYKTQNGGISWQLLFVNPDEKGFFDAMGFFNQKVGLVLGDPIDGYFVIYKTEDGGKSFRRIAKNKIPPVKKDEAAFAASGNTLLVDNKGKAWFTSGGNGAFVYSSSDFGESWKKETVPLHDKTATSGGYALALNDKKQLFVLGGDYQKRHDEYVHISTKVKDSWLVPGGEVARGLRTAMSCSGGLCLNTGKHLTSISFDGGANWQLFGFEGYYTMASPKKGEGSNKRLFLMAGEQGKVGVLTFKL